MLDTFGFWVPIEKGGVKESENGERLIYGVASTEDLDLDNEIVSASGLRKSLDYFLKHGRIDYDHKSKDEPKYIIGEPIEGRFDHDNRMHLKGKLYKGLEIADQCWALMKAGTTRMGWSIGGKIVKKAMQFDKSLQRFVPRVVEAIINHVALTPHPKNLSTFATANAYGSFMKSLASGESLGQVVNLGGKDFIIASREDFEKAISTGSGGPAGGTTAVGSNPVIPQHLESDVRVFRKFVSSKHFTGDANAAKQWFKSQGLSDDRADALAAYIGKNHKRILGIHR